MKLKKNTGNNDAVNACALVSVSIGFFFGFFFLHQNNQKSLAQSFDFKTLEFCLFSEQNLTINSYKDENTVKDIDNCISLFGNN